MSKHYPLETVIEFANQGNPEFQHRLARHHLARTKDHGEAKKWLELAADQGYVPALVDLGDIYLSDKYGIKNLDKAEQYFLKASELGGSDDMDKIGGAYYRYRHYNEAIKWLTLSAEQGNAWAQLDLGHLYQYNKKVRNFDEAIKWLTLAADHLAPASESLALIYYQIKCLLK